MVARSRTLSGAREAFRSLPRRCADCVRKKNAPKTLLFLMAALYTILFTATTFKEYNLFWYGCFDLGIFDQGIWLLSRFKDPYLTTRGLNLFGDHATFIHVLVAPIYWFWDSAKALLFLHTAALASGVFPLYLIAREKLKSDWAPLVLCFSFLLLPALHYSNLDQGYHSESFAVPLIMWAHWFLMRARYRMYFLSLFLAVICKEEIAFTLFLYGLYCAWKYNKRAGVAVSAFGVLWLVFVMNIVFPFYNGSEGAFYAGRTFGSFGETTQEKIGNFLNPAFLYGKLFTEENTLYVTKLLAPVGYLVFLEPLAFFSAASLWMSLLQDWPYAHQIQYHYVTPIIPVMYIAICEGISRISKYRKLTLLALFILLASALYGNYAFSPDQFTLRDPMRPVDAVMKFDELPQDKAKILEMAARIPANASVSATYTIVPQISHREKIYMFPNPFRPSYFGIDDKGVAPDNETEYIFVELGLINREERVRTFERITNGGGYVLADKYGQYELWKKADA